jgi:hypothetical protein
MPFGITLSEDEVGSISTEQFEEFSLPTLGKLSEHFGGRMGVHCCANAKHQWGLFKSIPGLVMLNLVQPDERIREASAYFRGSACQMFNPDQNGCTDRRARVVLQGTARSKKEALDTCAQLRDMAAQFHLT